MNEDIRWTLSIFFSIGSVAFEGLKFLKSDTTIVPQTIILDRGMASTYKVAKRLYFFPFWFILYAAAYFSNWNANPEAACLAQAPYWAGKSVIHIEATKDYYFSEEGAYDASFCSNLRDYGIKTHSGKFYAPGFTERNQHSLPRGLLYNNPDSGSSIESFLPMNPCESVSEALMREIYLHPGYTSSSYHQSLIVGGNAENLDLVLLRSYPLLESFLNHQKVSQK